MARMRRRAGLQEALGRRLPAPERFPATGVAYDAAVNPQPSASRSAPSRAAGRVVAIVPVGGLEGAKSRLGDTLDAEERRDLTIGLLTRTLEAIHNSPGIAEMIVVSPDNDVRRLALAAGARPLRQRSQGLNRGLREARDEALARGATAIAIVPVDLPLISPEAIAGLLAPLVDPGVDAGPDPGRPLVVLVPDRHGRGTNAMLMAPPDAIEFQFGGDSRAAHADCAREAGARLVELADSALALDLDTPDDLLLVEGLASEAVDAV
jgi:2-phospho-L-lactate guanylyltransferase